MDENLRAKITDNTDFLCENTYSLRDIIQYLQLQYDVFSRKEEEDMLSHEDNEEQLRDFYDLIVRKGKHAYERLIEALQATRNSTVLKFLQEGDEVFLLQSLAKEFEQTPPSSIAISEKNYQIVLRKSLVQCCNKISNLVILLNSLQAEGIISKHEMSVVQSKPTDLDRNSELFGFVLPKKSHQKFSVLLNCLRESENEEIEQILIAHLRSIGN